MIFFLIFNIIPLSLILFNTDSTRLSDNSKNLENITSVPLPQLMKGSVSSSEISQIEDKRNPLSSPNFASNI